MKKKRNERKVRKKEEKGKKIKATNMLILYNTILVLTHRIIKILLFQKLSNKVEWNLINLDNSLFFSSWSLYQPHQEHYHSFDTFLLPLHVPPTWPCPKSSTTHHAPQNRSAAAGPQQNGAPNRVPRCPTTPFQRSRSPLATRRRFGPVCPIPAPKSSLSRLPPREQRRRRVQPCSDRAGTWSARGATHPRTPRGTRACTWATTSQPRSPRTPRDKRRIRHRAAPSTTQTEKPVTSPEGHGRRRSFCARARAGSWRRFWRPSSA